MSGALYAEYERLYEKRQSKQAEAKKCWGSRLQEIEYEINKITERLEHLAGEMEAEEEWRNVKFAIRQAGGNIF